jgi:hypothetical protein
LTTGETVVLKVTVPLKPFDPLIVTVKLAEEPLAMVWLVGVATIVKSGIPVTVTETPAERDNAALVPLTVTL